MARKPRIHRSGAFYHVMLRGNNGQQIFFREEDRCRLCLLIQEGVHRFGHQIHGFCFMSNHIHLILQVDQVPISQSMQHLAFRYARYINRKEKRIGHLFQGRFKAILIDDSNYLLELIRYIHLNPVRAKLVESPESYRWSTHRIYLGSEDIPWISQDWILRKFDTHEDTSRLLYERYVNKAIGEESNDSLLEIGSHEGRLLGTNDFVHRVLSESHQAIIEEHPYSLEELIDVVCKVLNEPISVVQQLGKQRQGSETRALIAFFVRKSPHLTLKEFATLAKRDISAVSKQAVSIELKMKNDERIAKAVSVINEEIKNIQIAKSQA